jgi:hypothetical protein
VASVVISAKTVVEFSKQKGERMEINVHTFSGSTREKAVDAIVNASQQLAHDLAGPIQDAFAECPAVGDWEHFTEGVKFGMSIVITLVLNGELDIGYQEENT